MLFRGDDSNVKEMYFWIEIIFLLVASNSMEFLHSKCVVLMKYMLPIAALLHALNIFINNEIIWVVKIGIYIHQISANVQ